MRLPKSSYQWSLKHLISEGDTDLFPTPFEIDAIKKNWSKILREVSHIDVENYQWKGGRRFVLPKDVLAFRIATQLDPIDSLIFAAIMKKYGDKIEKNRIPYDKGYVFSYRYKPDNAGRFYGPSTTWHDFWRFSLQKASAQDCKWVLMTDITDYYNQIYHHVLENQIRDSEIPPPIFKAIQNFLGTMTDGVSRGIPVGPHSVHLLAEAALNTTDKSLLSRRYHFCRYVDDIHIFCASKAAAEIALYDLAEILDKQQRLTIQKQKTRLIPAKEFIKLAEYMLLDRPANEQEATLLKVISSHTNDDPYRLISIKALTEKDLKAVSKPVLERLLEVYLRQDQVNYPRIGWLLRRLAQIGVPGALEYTLKNLRKLTPVLGAVARYIIRASENYPGDLKNLGGLLIAALDVPLVSHSEYLQIVLLNLFYHVRDLDHIDKITSVYDKAAPAIRRQIIRAATAADQSHWLRERKDEFRYGDPWLRRAILAAAPKLPGDEAQHWIKKVKGNMTGLEKIVTLWACDKKKAKVGDIKIV